ncbi:hypothetical protein NDU88_006346 [Pleurodeles waltl]|uniref:Uncharacterized protein n=1 Tax=Pleurodeles waltl TaxID=8319 RepID=A0AAV7VLN8_PLEWA|nr:hypothetical protein NDU88_006346 [Pleurodeles waltl]
MVVCPEAPSQGDRHLIRNVVSPVTFLEDQVYRLRVVALQLDMPSNTVSAGKRKVRDPELSQLLKLVLAKLGNEDSDSGDVASDNEDNVAGSGRPGRSHVAPRTAFPPVKHRNKGRVAAAQPPLSSPADSTPPEQSPMLDTLLPSTSATSEPHVGGENLTPAPGHGLAVMLAYIRKSLAALAAPSLGQEVQPSPQLLA